MTMNQALKDHKGRPFVVVTGIGIVTSLGEGKEDNWRRLTAGESGISRISRFPTEGLRTEIAGTIDWVADEPFSRRYTRSTWPKNPPTRPLRNPASVHLESSPARCSWPIRQRKPTGTSA